MSAWRIPLLAAVTLAALAVGGQSPSRPRGPVTVQLLAVNDFHGNLEPPAGANGRINSGEAGGAEYLATHLKQAAAGNPYSIVVAAGDLIGASPLLSSLFHDEPTIEAMNAMNLAVSSVGNHEFDEGIPEILRMKRGACHPKDGCQDGDGFTGATFQYLSANVVRPTARTPLFPATAIRTIDGVKVGFIGETLAGTKHIVPTTVTRSVTFLDEASVANRWAAQLKRQGVHAIVLLIHEGGRQGPTDEEADPNGCVDFRGPIQAIVEKLTSDIQVVVSGHTHRFYNCRIGTHVVTSAGSYGRMITRINLGIDRASGRVTSASAINEVVTRDVAKDPVQTRILQKYGSLVEARANTVIGSATADLTRAANDAGESSLGDIVADAQLAAARAIDRTAAVAFMNPGGIRADLAIDPEGPAARRGEASYRELYAVQPFGNRLTLVTMTGEMIKRLLEQQFDNPSPGARKILQVPSGFTYQYRMSAPAGQRVVADSIQLDGRRITAADRIRVAASDFLVDGGDGFTVFGEGTSHVAGITDIEALVAYFTAHSPVAPGPQNRIVRLD